MSTDFDKSHPQSLADDFEVAEGVWEGFKNQSLLKEEIEANIAREAQERAEKMIREEKAELLDALKAEATESGKQAGFEEGLKQARERLDSFGKAIETKAAGMNRELDAWTRQLEKDWTEALFHIVDELVTSDGEGRAAEIAKWVRRHLDDSFKDQRIRIYIGSKEWNLIETSGIPADAKHWEWQLDPALKDGQIRCESKIGRLFLDRVAFLDQLNQILKNESN